MLIDVIRYEPSTFSLRPFKFFFQQLHGFLQLRSCLIERYEKELKHNYGGPQGQYRNIYPSTKIFIPVQKYFSQYKNIYPSTKIFIPVQKYLSQYKNIFPNTKIFIPVQKYLSQYKNIFPSTKIFFPVQKYFSSTNREWDLFSQRSLRASLEHM